MPRLFETFVRNFLRRHLPEARVTARQLAWDAQGDTAEAQALLPVMKTDVTLEWGNERCVVLDCKFYANSFTQSFDQAKLKSANLYQIAAYLHHHPYRSKGVPMHGVLLYPAVGADFLHHYDFMGHRLTVASVDLLERWQTIHDRLLQVVRTTERPERAATAELVDLDAELVMTQSLKQGMTQRPFAGMPGHI